MKYRFILLFILAIALTACGSQTAQLSPSDQQATATANAASISATNVAIENAGPGATVTLPTADTSTPVQTHALRNELEEILSHVLEVEGMQNLMQ